MQVPEAVSKAFQFVNMFGKIMYLKLFKLPNGKVKDFYMWDSTTRPVMIFALTDDNQVIVLDQYCYAVEKVVEGEVPGGCIDEGEPAIFAATRELRKETGYEAKNWVFLGDGFFFEPHNFAVGYSIYLARGCRLAGAPQTEETEFIEVRTVPLREWIMLVDSGRVHDSKTVVATNRALAYLGFARVAPGDFKH